MKEQLRDLREGRLGGEKPETKYLNKKREFVRQLMHEKRDAVDKGVKDKLQNMESEMIDEMLQAALNLDVDQEVETRLEKARKMVEDGKLDASASASYMKASHSRSAKKNVKFQSPTRAAVAQSAHSQSVSKSGKHASALGASMGQSFDDGIGESI